ncbi:MAG: NAD(P)-dependent oxidoreductase [Verrucomicrobiales bacterium]|nr:NAD(P)-dependent oxidoreductase [Verrucomicrobiales bacterium]
MDSGKVTGSIGIVGLGLMGTALAERFLEAGFEVRVWNRTRDKAEGLLTQGAIWSDHPLSDVDCVLISLYTTNVVSAVLDGFAEAWRPGLTLIDTTTGDPGKVEALAARLAGCGVDYLEAPISGSSVQTRRGESTVIVGGTKESFDRWPKLWEIMGARVIRSGEIGSASRMKLISNLVLGLNRAVLAEGLAYAEAIGVKPAAALEVLSASMAYSRAMDVKGRKMVERDYSVQARLSQHLKDVRLILDTAAGAKVPLPFTEVHRTLMERAEAKGLGDLDNSAILEVLRPTSPPQGPVEASMS